MIRPNTQETMVGMGQALAIRAPGRLWSILGSCVAVALFDPKRRVAAMAHVVLPAVGGRPGPPGKYADSAVPHLLKLLAELGARGDGLVAKLAGGARMFGHPMPMEVGENNVLASLQALQTAGIRVAARDTGGTHGRRVTFDVAAGTLIVEVLGAKPIVL